MISAGRIGDLIKAYSAASFFFHLLVFIALFIMRVTHAKEPRFFKVKEYLFTRFIYLCINADTGLVYFAVEEELI